jgi:hypothetical protein
MSDSEDKVQDKVEQLKHPVRKSISKHSYSGSTGKKIPRAS